MVPGAAAYIASDAGARSQTTTRLLAAQRSGFVTSQELFTEEEYLADPMMTEWGAANGLCHGAATAIHVPNGDLVVVQIQRRRGEPGLDPADIAVLDGFRPHLARAGLLAARWRLERLRAAAEALALVGLPAAAVLDLTGRVMAANAPIEAHQPHVVWRSRDRIGFRDAAAETCLQQALHRLRQPATARGLSFPAGAQDGTPAVPTTGHARDVFGGAFGVLVITPVTMPDAPDAVLLQALYDLTPAEARVAGGIARGMTPDQIAARQAVSIETVRVSGTSGDTRKRMFFASPLPAASSATQGRPGRSRWS